MKKIKLYNLILIIYIINKYYIIGIKKYKIIIYIKLYIYKYQIIYIIPEYSINFFS
jgi:hypothetical protein